MTKSQQIIMAKAIKQAKDHGMKNLIPKARVEVLALSVHDAKILACAILAKRL